MSKELEALDCFNSSLEFFLNKTTDTYCQLTFSREQATEFVKEYKTVKQVVNEFNENKKSEITGLSFNEFKEIHKNDTSAEALDFLHRLSLTADYVKPNSVEEKARRFLRDKVEQALLELQAIKETNPSEALGCLEEIGALQLYYDDGDFEDRLENHNYYKKPYNTIKQALIKAEKLEKVLNVIFRKKLKIEFFKNVLLSVGGEFEYQDYEKVYTIYGEEKLTEEEFELVKEMLK